jgi:NAD(P)-dependent dehydrogenase (short-subunit alcohol dehydrogenase family)
MVWRVAQSLARDGANVVVINRQLPTRQAGQLGWALDQLTAHHRQPPSGASPVQGVIPVVIVRPTPGSSDEVTLDFADIASRARAAVRACLTTILRSTCPMAAFWQVLWKMRRRAGLPLPFLARRDGFGGYDLERLPPRQAQ